MAVSEGRNLPKVGFFAESLSAATTTGEIDLSGATLTGLLLEGDISSTSFTITVARITGGTFVTVKDPEAAGADKSYTIAATATGYYPINPQDTAGFRFCKIVFGSSETATVYIANRSME